MRHVSRWMGLSLVLIALLLADQAYAKDRISRDSNDIIKGTSCIMGGRVIKAEPRERDGQHYYNIRILSDDGKMRRIQIDSKSGRRLKGRGRDRR